MFSKELYELDKNTVQYMTDEQQKELDVQKAKLEVEVTFIPSRLSKKFFLKN